MSIRLEDKKAIVAEVNEVAAAALSAVIGDQTGVSVGQMTVLRKQAREQGVYLRVVRNTLAKRAVSGTEFECLQDQFIGPTLLAFSKDDPGAAARLFKEFGKENKALSVRALAVGGKVYGEADIDVLASLPTYDEAIAQLMSVMLAPVQKLAGTLNEIPGKLVRTLAAVKDQKAE